MFDIIPDIKPSTNMLRCTLSGGEPQMGRGRLRPDAEDAPIVARRASLGLAPVAMQEVFQIIAEIKKRGTTVLLVEQNAHMALKVANWGYVLESGRLALGGDSATLWSDERIRDAYLGGEQVRATT
jgi:branched-chain amino acid transport system ATP-binding protein